MKLRTLDTSAVRTQSAPRVTTLSHQGLKKVVGGGTVYFGSYITSGVYITRSSY
ncbi:MAG: hypothetical protein KC549_18865 [Myxococcales bacterium]|nr:hypothetical protein [Myxococcales bacterium]MCB9545631.1 hypothetical protein [Myxococcales bacterium]